MCDATTIVRERQMAVRREIDRRKIALKVAAADAKLHVSTFTSYFPTPGGAREPAVLPLAALFQIVDGKALPLDLIDMLMPEGFMVMAVPEGVDHHEAGEAMQEFLTEKARAHHPDSPEGPAIAPCEEVALNAKLARVRSVS